MKRTAIAILAATVVAGHLHAAVVEVGDLNIIDDATNPSHGLRYLDMTYSDGLSQAAALTNAQATYPDARLATQSEFDDLFAAAGITYDGALTASDAFSVGDTATISSGVNYDGGALALQLGYTDGVGVLAWSDPDGDQFSPSTRDFLVIDPVFSGVWQSPATVPHSDLGWLLVSEIPEPMSLSLLALGGLGVLIRRKKK